MHRPTLALLALLMLLLAAPLAAYTIYFKDGRTLQTKGTYKIVNGRAVVTLLNGTQASFDPTDIDNSRTEEMNKKDLGATVILDQGSARQSATPPPPAQPRLSDLAAKGGIGPRDQPARREPAPAAGGSSKTAGNDRFTAPRKPYRDAEVANELRQFFLGQKVEGVDIYEGTRSGRPLAEVVTSSEGSVFRALSVGANALLHIRDRFPQKVEGMELMMVTPEHERAGQFYLTPEMAESLVARRVGLVSFFLDNVQF